MEFSQVKKAAQTVLEKNQDVLTITKSDESQHQIHLTSREGRHNFCITCPTKESPEWTVWSELPNSQKLSQDVMDTVDVKKPESLTKMLELLCRAVGMDSLSTTDASNGPNNTTEEEDDDYEDEDDDDEYYAFDDVDAQVEASVADMCIKEEEAAMAQSFSKSSGSPTAVNRLVKDLKVLTNESHKFGIVGSPRDSNLFEWDVKLINIPLETRLGKDLKQHGLKHKEEAAIHLRVKFPSDYPYNPPFIRVVRPRFKFLTGHVTVGGSICMEMLTRSGWCPTNDLESILVQVRTEILSDPKASLDPHRAHEAYREDEAKYAFHRMVEKYGWS